MIEIISSWAKSLGVAIILVSILEMILPNNKTKKYIRMVLGIFIIFNIISPFIQNKDALDLTSINIEEYYKNETTSNKNEEKLNQTSMDQRIKELYQEELEKDIESKLESNGYKINNCKVEAKLPENEDEIGIEKIKLKIEEKNTEKQKEEDNNNEQEKTIEDKIVIGVQKIKEIDVSEKNEEANNNESDEENYKENENNKKITKSDIQNVKKILIEEYGVNEKCLEIN